MAVNEDKLRAAAASLNQRDVIDGKNPFADVALSESCKVIVVRFEAQADGEHPKGTVFDALTDGDELSVDDNAVIAKIVRDHLTKQRAEKVVMVEEFAAQVIKSG